MRCASASKRSIARLAQRVGRASAGRRVNADAARNDVDRAGRRLDAADGADHAVLGVLARDPLDRAASSRRRRRARRGAASSARCRRGRPRRAPSTRSRLWPTMPVTTPSGWLFGFQHRPLLDVHLDIADDVAAVGRRLRRCRRRSCRRRCSASPSVTPLRVRQAPACRVRTRRRRPTTTASVAGKREPSSSPKASTSMPNGSVACARAKCSTARMPAITPSGPS